MANLTTIAPISEARMPAALSCWARRHIACLDYSVADGGSLIGARWHGGGMYGVEWFEVNV